MRRAWLGHLEQVIEPGEHVDVPVLETLEQPVEQFLKAGHEIVERAVCWPRGFKGGAVRPHREPAQVALPGQPEPELRDRLVVRDLKLVQDRYHAGAMLIPSLSAVPGGIKNRAHSAFYLAQEMRDQVSDSSAARILAEQSTRGDKKLGWPLTDLPQPSDDALLPSRQSPPLGARLVC